MTDTIVKGSGNSRKLITVPNAPTLYPDHETLMQKWATEGIPVDIGPLLAIGCDVIGTAYGKATVLPDSLCSALDLPTTATPAQALEKIRALSATAQGTADGRAKIEVGSYTGDGEANKTLQFGFNPKLVIVYGYPGFDRSTVETTYEIVAIAGYGIAVSCLRLSSYRGNAVYLEWGEKSLKYMVSGQYDNAGTILNGNGATYQYVAIG